MRAALFTFSCRNNKTGVQVVQENNATTSSARKANAELLAKVAHDSSLVLYWPAMLPVGSKSAGLLHACSSLVLASMWAPRSQGHGNETSDN